MRGRPLMVSPGKSKLRRRLDVQRDPVAVQEAGDPAGVPDEPHRIGALADQDEDAFSRGPRRDARLSGPKFLKLPADLLRGEAQRQLAQGAQVPRTEKPRPGALRLLAQVDLALLEPLQQLLKRKVHQLDRVGPLDKRIRDGFLDRNPGNLCDDVVERLEVLDVERRVDTDPAVE